MAPLYSINMEGSQQKIMKVKATPCKVREILMFERQFLARSMWTWRMDRAMASRRSRMYNRAIPSLLDLFMLGDGMHLVI